MRFFLTLALTTGVLCAQTQQQSPELLEKTKAAAKAAVGQQKQGAGTASPDKPANPAAPRVQLQAAPAQQSAPADNVMTMDPAKVVATVDGQPVTAGELQAIIGTLAPQVQQQATGNLNAVLEQYGVTRRLAAEAEKNKLHQTSPYKDALEVTRIRILAQAEMSYYFNTAIPVTDEAVRAAYEKDKADFQQARVKAIYIPFGSSANPAPTTDPKAAKPLTEPEAKAKVDQVVKLARGGSDFVKLVKEHSKDPNSSAKDGDFGVVAKNSPIPEHIKTAIFAAKVGQVTDPVRQPNGFYVFRVEEVTTPPFDQIRASLVEQIKNAKFSEWLQQQQRQVKIEGLTSSAGSQQPPQPQASK